VTLAFNQRHGWKNTKSKQQQIKYYYLFVPTEFIIHFVVQQETQRLLAEPVEGVSATPYEDNIRYFNVAIAGPLGTPYEGK